MHEHSLIQKVRFCFNVIALYALTIGFGWYVVHPVKFLNHARPVAITRSQQTPYQPGGSHAKTISGKPVRIVIPGSSVDLPVDEGYYDSTANSWTLSGYRAQFAMISTLANNRAGDTFIYGHNNNYVFGALRHVTPQAGAQALIYTANGHIFSYKFIGAQSVAPDDTTALRYEGPPTLTIQTCTGSLNEWRTMFRFSFDKVVQ